MKKVHLTSAFLAVLLTSLSLVAQEAESKPQPKIEVEETTHKIEEAVVQGTVLQHEFILRNSGDAPLEIKHIGVDKTMRIISNITSIEPGKEATLVVEVDTIYFSDHTGWTITVQSNDPTNPSLRLDLVVAIEASLRLSSPDIRWVYVQYEGDATIKTVLASLDGQKFSVTDIKSPLDFISIQQRAALDSERIGDLEGPQYVLELTLREDAPVGAIAGRAEIFTDHPKQKRLQLPLSGFVRPIMHVTPTQFDIGTVSVTEEQHLMINVRSFATEPMKITDITHDVQGLTYRLEPTAEGRIYELLIDLKDLPKGPLEGTITLKTNFDKVPVYKVRMKGNVVD